MNRIARPLTFLATILIVAQAPAGGWTHYAGHAARNAIAAFAPATLDNVLWSARPGADEEFVARSTPVASQGRVFVNTRRFTDFLQTANLVIAYNAGSGRRMWTAEVPADVNDSWSSPAIDTRNSAVVIATGRSVTALDLGSGAPLWQTELTREVVNASPAVTIDRTNAAVPVNRVFITDSNSFGVATLYAINVDPFDATVNPFLPGQIVWTADLPGATGSTPSYRGGAVYVTTTSGFVCAFNAADGAALWQTDASPLECDPSGGLCGFFGGAARHGDFVYAASFAFDGGQNNSRLYKFSATTGAIVWSVCTERTDAIPIVTPGGMVIVSGGIDGFGSTAKIQAYADLGDHAQLMWDTAAPDSVSPVLGGWTHQPLLSEQRLYAGSPDPFAFLAPYADLCVLDLSKTPADPGFVVSRHVGSGGSPAADVRLFSIGVGGLFCFEQLGLENPHVVGELGN